MCFSIAIDKNIKNLSKIFNASVRQSDAEHLQKIFTQQVEMEQKKFETLLGLPNSKRRPMPFKLPDKDNRVLPGTFANVIVQEGDSRILKPMRYSVSTYRHKDEIAGKFGAYNARIDSFTNDTWSPLFMRQHGLIPFTNFYEWVLGPNEINNDGLFNFLDESGKNDLVENSDPRKRLITFYPEGRNTMWAPCFWEKWSSKNGEISFETFAIITDDAPPEVDFMGHDRCPIFLKHDYINEWLNPHLSNKNEIYDLLKEREEVKFSYKWIS